MFFGLHERQLDDKGRVALPVAFRNQLGARLYVAYGPNRCLDVWSADQFEQTAAGVAERVRRGELTMANLRAITHSATEVQVDAQGRIKVDERLRAFADLEPSAKVVITGAYDHLELWSEAVYADVDARQSNDMALGE